MKTVDEQNIIRKLFERDEAALREVEQQYASLCLTAALRILGDEEARRNAGTICFYPSGAAFRRTSREA